MNVLIFLCFGFLFAVKNSLTLCFFDEVVEEVSSSSALVLVSSSEASVFGAFLLEFDIRVFDFDEGISISSSSSSSSESALMAGFLFSLALIMLKMLKMLIFEFKNLVQKIRQIDSAECFGQVQSNL